MHSGGQRNSFQLEVPGDTSSTPDLLTSSSYSSQALLQPSSGSYNETSYTSPLNFQNQDEQPQMLSSPPAVERTRTSSRLPSSLEEADKFREQLKTMLEQNAKSSSSFDGQENVDASPPVSTRPNDDAGMGFLFSRRQTNIVFAALCLAIFISAMDVTIVATALPRIIAELGSIDKYSWVVTAYLLGFTGYMPISGKMSDIFGRRPTIIMALVLFMAGSAACGAAKSMEMLIVARAIQGVGGGGVLALIMIIISGKL
ncbi:hypothetical protein HDU76_009999 [Blyttiomyces sp. JEL0837]|nr:hypothetical protein HDU76_009999 [Blyttiomyces sp. JEL0837]